MRELRFWDTFNGVMTYSRNFKNMAIYFAYRQKVIDGGNHIEDMLSTELPDKNGKIIFEGDVVKQIDILNPHLPRNQEIVFIDGAFKAEDTPLLEYVEETNRRKWFTIEIIGNKFENPELMEEK